MWGGGGGGGGGGEVIILNFCGGGGKDQLQWIEEIVLIASSTMQYV